MNKVSKNNSQNVQAIETGPTPATETETVTANVQPIRLATSGNSLLGKRVSETSKALNDKLVTMQTARQKLAEATDLINGSEAERAKGMSLVGEGGKLLYQGVMTNAILREEVTGTLGDIFGWKAKGKGADKTKPVFGTGDHASKTPFGVGEHLRKRINRAIDGHDFVTNKTETTFFSGLPEAEVAAIIETVNDKDGSLWTAYDALAELKREHKDASVPFAVNPARIAGLAEELRSPAIAQALADNPALQDAYAALLSMINVIDQEAAEIVNLREAA